MAKSYFKQEHDLGESQHFISWRVVFVDLYSYQIYVEEKNLIEWTYMVGFTFREEEGRGCSD